MLTSIIDRPLGGKHCNNLLYNYINILYINYVSIYCTYTIYMSFLITLYYIVLELCLTSTYHSHIAVPVLTYMFYII